MDQEQDRPSSDRPRKLRFIPKPRPPSRSTRSTIPRKEENDKDNSENEAAQAEKLMNKFTANLRRNVPKTEKKSSKQVAFGPGATSETSVREYGVRRSERVSSNSCLEVKDSFDYNVDDNGNMVAPSPSVVTKDGMMQHPSEARDELARESKTGHEEPWDYSSYYPTTLPWRRPYSSNPEDEFGSTTDDMEYDENTINPAGELGLLEESERERLFFFQLPSKLPIIKRSAGTKGKEKAESSTLSATNRYGSLEDLSGGYMGKMLVYKSGKVKLKLGDMLYDVSPGVDRKFGEDVKAMNTDAKHCCSIGEVEKRVVVTPDIDFLLNQ